MKKILIVDDDQHIGNMLEEALRREGYGILRAYSGTEALYVLDRERPDLVLLDLMLPGLNGEELLPRISGIPVIVASAKADVGSKVSLLLGGAADYVTKPFDLQELLARISVQLRMAEGKTDGGTLVFEHLSLDLNTHTVTLRESGIGEEGVPQACRREPTAGTAEGPRCVSEPGAGTAGVPQACACGSAAGAAPVRLTRTEFAILKLLMQNPSQVLPKSLLLERIAGDTPDCTESSLKMHVSNLRKKLRELDGQDYIEAVWGIGFRLRPAAER